jgi:hypothetical protein
LQWIWSCCALCAGTRCSTRSRSWWTNCASSTSERYKSCRVVRRWTVSTFKLGKQLIQVFMWIKCFIRRVRFSHGCFLYRIFLKSHLYLIINRSTLPY